MVEEEASRATGGRRGGATSGSYGSWFEHGRNRGETRVQSLSPRQGGGPNGTPRKGGRGPRDFKPISWNQRQPTAPGRVCDRQSHGTAGRFSTPTAPAPRSADGAASTRRATARGPCIKTWLPTLGARGVSVRSSGATGRDRDREAGRGTRSTTVVQLPGGTTRCKARKSRGSWASNEGQFKDRLREDGDRRSGGNPWCTSQDERLPERLVASTTSADIGSTGRRSRSREHAIPRLTFGAHRVGMSRKAGESVYGPGLKARRPPRRCRMASSSGLGRYYGGKERSDGRSSSPCLSSDRVGTPEFEGAVQGT